MGKEFILRIQVRSGRTITVRAWGWSAGDAFQKLKKNDPDAVYLIDHRPA